MLLNRDGWPLEDFWADVFIEETKMVQKEEEVNGLRIKEEKLEEN